MAVFKCKLCGGTIEPRDGGIGICDSCGTKQTIPNMNDEKKMNLLDRANHFRMQNDFDKAMAIYEQILDEDTTDSDVYYSIALCRYGIAYVDDPKSKRKIPTINRMQNKQFSEDADFKMAIKYAKPEQEKLYSNEGAYIDKVQQGIMDITKNEKPYDVFICYKETDDNGERTHDSVLANDLYYGLTNEGFKVFFARITLEGKLGTAYEPYIFSALNSSKVMVVIGTKAEYFNAVWVKNEWSRFLSLINDGANKTLIPAYKDMDPYDLPDEFANLQAQDMSKLGFMQDLIRGINKIINGSGETRGTLESNKESNKEIHALLKRVRIFLEDMEFDKANEYCEKALDIDAEDSDVYFYKLMVETQSMNEDKLISFTKRPLESFKSYIYAMKFGNDLQKEKLNDICSKNTYYNAGRLIEKKEYEQAIKLYEKIPDFDDSKNKILAAKDGLYNEALEMMENGSYNSAIEIFNKILDHKDSSKKIEQCNYEKTNKLYENGMKELQNKNYEIALNCFCRIPDFKNSAENITICNDFINQAKYSNGCMLMRANAYDRAFLEFKDILHYKDSKQRCYKCFKSASANIKSKYTEFSNDLMEQINEENRIKRDKIVEAAKGKAKGIAGKMRSIFNKNERITQKEDE